MDVFSIALLTATGLVAGIVASTVGGAAVIVYPAMIAAGVPPQAATVCCLAAITPGSMLAALADRSQLPPLNRAFIGLILVSLTGAGLGSLLLLLTPARLFTAFVPVLLGFATVLFAYSGRISNYLRTRAAERGRNMNFDIGSLKVLFPVSFYGGYFGAGAGILYLAVFSLATGGAYRAANVAKNFVSSFNGMAATLVFASQGAIPWPQTVTLMIGTMAGGYIGSYVARVIPAVTIRWLIVAIGAALTLFFAREYWF